ncbi:protein kinase [Gemmatimonadota bacterium Y43]|uniref:serine/threonine-protein kinase n=1 Tax=Gaopeijia maritima TaxID=3119007 RepID=UPI00327D5527
MVTASTPPTRPCEECGRPLPDEGRFCAHCGSFSGASGTASRPGAVPRQGPWQRILPRLQEVVAPRYEVQRLLGWGGMAGVYLAEEVRLKRRVAIKVIAPGLLMDPSQIERFEQEARTTAQLEHPNIVTIYEVNEREDLHYFTMTYVPGRSLGQVMAEASEPLAVEVVTTWLRQVAGALSYAHDRGVVHRDIKPGNILLDGDGNALVGDFGIAKVAEEPGLTRTGMLVGTPAYMSPEQCTTGKVSGASDQYSLGVVAYMLLCGEPPFDGSTIQVIQAHVNEAPQDIRERRADCPDALADVVMRMLAKAPGDRWPTLDDAIDALGGRAPRRTDPVRAVMARLSAWTHGVQLEFEDSGSAEQPSGPVELAVGDERRVRAVAIDHRGGPFPDRAVTFTTDPEGVIEVDEGGRFEAVSAGRVTLRATSGRARAERVVEVIGAAAVAETMGAGSHAEPGSESGTDVGPDVPTDAGAGAVADATAATGTRAAAPAASKASLHNGATRTPAETAAPAAPVFTRSRRRPDRPDRSWGPAVAAGLAVLVVGAGGLTWALRDSGPAAGDDSTPAAEVPESRTEATAASADPLAGGVETGDEGATGSDAALDVADAGAAAENDAADPPAPPADDPSVNPGTGRAAESTPTSTTPPREASPAAPEPGTLRVVGTLPAGATVRVRGPGVNEVVAGGSARLAPGRYTVEFGAPGYEPARTEIDVRSGVTADWRPAPEPVAAEPESTDPAPTANDAADDPPASEPPATPDDAAAVREARIVAAIEAFGAALVSREPSRLRTAWPSISDADARPWEQFMASRDVRDLQVDITVPSVPEGSDDPVQVPFLLRLRYQNPGAPPPADPIPYRATVRRDGDRWVLAGLQAGN